MNQKKREYPKANVLAVIQHNLADDVLEMKRYGVSAERMAKIFRERGNYVGAHSIRKFLKQYQKKKIGDFESENSYKIEEHSNTENKQWVNQVILKHLKGITPQNALILDAADTQSTKNAIKAGFDSNNIYIPNCHPFTWKTIKRSHKNCFLMTMGEYLKMSKDKTYSYIFADYCGTWNGVETEEHSPKTDTKYIFEHKLLKDNSLFGITLCSRGAKTKRLESLKEILDISTKAKYSLNLLEVKEYIGAMYFILFKVKMEVE